jgi:hypothetical protein
MPEQMIDALSVVQTEATAGVVSVNGAEALEVSLYATTDMPSEKWTQEAAIPIPENRAYYTHSAWETTGLGDKDFSAWVVRNPNDPNRVIEVRLKVQVRARWFARSWCGAKLVVTVTPK